MNHLICTHCAEEIPTGFAVIRSRNFQRVAFHQECAAELGIAPLERRPLEPALLLANRVA